MKKGVAEAKERCEEDEEEERGGGEECTFFAPPAYSTRLIEGGKSDGISFASSSV